MKNITPTTPVKLVLLGESSVGKSSLVLRFVSNNFHENKGVLDIANLQYD